MRPERIIIGECRGGESLDMLQAMNTGHAGSMTTLHANTPRDAMARIETMITMAGVPLAEVIQMASYNPARIMNIHHQKGSLETGKDADMVIFDEDIDISTTIVNGNGGGIRLPRVSAQPAFFFI